jgi:sugar phosphate isomerase/epimerase
MTAQPVMGRPASSVRRRVAGAPVSWGVCEVPDWGYQLPVDRVLADMRVVGLSATEFGPDGYLPTDPGQRSRLLAEYGLTAAGGFVRVVLHDPAVDVIAEVDRALDAFARGVAGGLFRPLGQGDVDVAGVAAALEAADYRGWYVLEQDTMLDGPPQDEGPVRAVRESLYYLRGLLGGQR